MRFFSFTKTPFLTTSHPNSYRMAIKNYKTGGINIGSIREVVNMIHICSSTLKESPGDVS